MLEVCIALLKYRTPAYQRKLQLAYDKANGISTVVDPSTFKLIRVKRTRTGWERV